MRFFVILAFMLSSCTSPKQKIIGKWKFIKNIENNIEVPRISKDVKREVELFQDGKLVYYNDSHVIGIGTYTYKIKGDSIYLTNKRGSDSSTFASHYSINYDTLKVETNNHLTIWQRIK